MFVKYNCQDIDLITIYRLSITGIIMRQILLDSFHLDVRVRYNVFVLVHPTPFLYYTLEQAQGLQLYRILR